MGLSLRKGYGLDNKSLSGDFASKMWSSYTQLNPGVYSEAIATEFKRRMKPDYVENLVPNGGGLNATDLIDTNSDGLADGFTGFFADYTLAIVSGNGFSGRAQRINKITSNGSMGIFMSSIFSLATSYTITFKYRTNSTTAYLYNAGATTTSTPLPVNTGNALPFTFTGTINNYAHLLFACLNTNVGDYLEVGEITVTRTISQNYFNTFGPAGLNKTTADWIGIMVTSNATVARTNTKTGAVMKWNLDGTIVTQNNTPAYTKGANAGIITFTSTDGFGGLTVIACHACGITHLSGLYGAINLSSIYCQVNQLTSLTTYSWTKLIEFYCNNNQLTSLPNTGTNKMSSDNESANLYTATSVDYRLAYYNTMFAATPPIRNLTLNLSGATMGIPTGAGSNTDLLGILAKFTAAGFTATIIVRTV